MHIDFGTRVRARDAQLHYQGFAPHDGRPRPALAREALQRGAGDGPHGLRRVLPRIDAHPLRAVHFHQRAHRVRAGGDQLERCRVRAVLLGHPPECFPAEVLLDLHVHADLVGLSLCDGGHLRVRLDAHGPRQGLLVQGGGLRTVARFLTRLRIRRLFGLRRPVAVHEQRVRPGRVSLAGVRRAQGQHQRRCRADSERSLTWNCLHDRILSRVSFLAPPASPFSFSRRGVRGPPPVACLVILARQCETLVRCPLAACSRLTT